jgi:hypothetical protein
MYTGDYVRTLGYCICPLLDTGNMIQEEIQEHVATPHSNKDSQHVHIVPQKQN